MSVASKEKLLNKLRNREYRNAYAEESVKTSLPFQIRAIREQREWSQAQLGREMEMKQNAVSRLESPDYGNLSVNTLLRAANALDCGLLVRFVPFSRLLQEFEDVSPNALEADKYEDDMSALERWANIGNSVNLSGLRLVVDNQESVLALQQTLPYQRGELHIVPESVAGGTEIFPDDAQRATSNLTLAASAGG